MTVLVWDNITLSADKQSTDGGHAYVVTKIFAVPDGIVGFVGSSILANSMLKWFQNGRLGVFRTGTKEGDDSVFALFIDKQRQVRGFFSDKGTDNYIIYHDTKMAFGCGRDYAIAAMYLGHDAEKAVEVACALDVFCGKGIDTLTLEDAK